MTERRATMAKAKVGSKEWIAENAELYEQGKRKCTKCREVKALDNGFYRDRSGRHGFAPHCKECDRKTQARWAKTSQSKAAVALREQHAHGKALRAAAKKKAAKKAK